MASRRLATAGKSRKKSRRHPGGEYDGSPRQKKKGKTKATQSSWEEGVKKTWLFPRRLPSWCGAGGACPGWTLPGRRARHRAAHGGDWPGGDRPAPLAVAGAAGTGTGGLSSCCLQASLHMWIPRKGLPGRPWPCLQRMFPMEPVEDSSYRAANYCGY